MFLYEQYLTNGGTMLQSIYTRVSLFGLFARSTMPCKADSSVLISAVHQIVLYSITISYVYRITLYGEVVVNIFKCESY